LVETLDGYFMTHACSTAFLSHKYTVFAELNIEILCANSSQAKGRVERANRTLRTTE
jgi:hypothetical protein